MITQTQKQILRIPFYCRSCNQTFDAKRNAIVEIILAGAPDIRICEICARRLRACLSVVLDNPTVTLAGNTEPPTVAE